MISFKKQTWSSYDFYISTLLSALFNFNLKYFLILLKIKSNYFVHPVYSHWWGIEYGSLFITKNMDSGKHVAKLYRFNS